MVPLYTRVLPLISNVGIELPAILVLPVFITEEPD